jgi:alanyl-tRNA synthetase
MLSDKEQKKSFKEIASQDPDKYYATSVLKKEGFERKQCDKCNLFFWSKDRARQVCGDASCSGGFRFLNNPKGNKMRYTEVWKKFSSMFEGFGYTKINRYPVVARWNPTMDYTIASIAAFQPHVVSGESRAPFEKLVIPQFCLRFGDIDNVGITGSHHTGFVMIGQHQFLSPERWNQDHVFSHILEWIKSGIGLPLEEVTFHEDAWAGGGNFGPCMEFFSGGVELGNQVYMLYEQTEDGSTELKLKILDMGMGQERVAWFTQGTPTIYDAVFPQVMEKLREATKLEVDERIIKKFVPYAGYLNIDEVENIDKSWMEVADIVGVEVSKLKNIILPSAALYSIGEHCRSLLVALNDGALPSNVGGGYNLRILIRRMLSFIDQYKWNIYLPDVCRWHAEELKSQFPELREKLDDIEEILKVEINRYENTKQKSKTIVERLIDKGQEITSEELIDLYDSQGISPESIREEGKKKDMKISIPDNFYALVSERHEKKEQIHSTKRVSGIKIEGIKGTEAMYFEDYSVVEFDSYVASQQGDHAILDKTYFYPTSGGQLHDLGELNGVKVVDVFKQGNVIIHKLENDGLLGEKVHGKIDLGRRKQLAQHHTATHIINAAAKKILGPHINQAGAKKNVDKAHLDITHYQSLSSEEVDAIEKEANSIIDKGIDTKLRFMERSEAEQRYGMEIYQGGAVPGNLLRIVEIPSVDVECCGGTHLHNTSEVGEIKIIKSTKIQDGVVRLEFVAGKRSEELDKQEGSSIKEISSLLKVEENKIPGRAQEVFETWKKAKKLLKKKKSGKDLGEFDLNLKSQEGFGGEVLEETAKRLKTQPEHIIKTLKRFISELEDMKKEL